MPTYVALLRGINVGKAKRVAMADLRALLVGLGHTQVSTLLMSGNAVFASSFRSAKKVGVEIEAAINEQFGLGVRVMIRTTEQLQKIVDGNPLPDLATENPSRFQVTLFEGPADATAWKPIVDADWSPEAFAVNDLATYAWHPDGVASSKLADAMGKVKTPPGTARNWATMAKVLDRARETGSS